MELKIKQEKKPRQLHAFLYGIVALEAFIFLFLIFVAVLPSIQNTYAVVGEDNVTVSTILTIGNVFPEVINVTINDYAASVDLSANATVIVEVITIVRDYNGEGDIANVSTRFFDNVDSSFEGVDDNNNHYTNNTCSLDASYGDVYTLQANCTFEVQYYASNQTWNATSLASDNLSIVDTGSDTIVINTLLALGLPNVINYGTVNATDVSDEIIANVTNFGNVFMNLSLSGYGAVEGDGLALNCSLGTVQNISLGYEKYNLTASNSSQLSLAQFQSLYTNLTNASAVKQFDLSYRTNDTLVGIGDTNSTYWRVYVPVGVAGSCSGNVVFGAVQGTGT